MARNNAPKIELTAYDDLFETDQSREEAALSKIRDIPIAEIDEFPDHPFKVLMDEDMEQLIDSIKRNGVMTPATVRLKEDGRYLGRYEVKETTAPYGMVLNEEVHGVELVYAGQNIAVTETATGFVNERQKVEIDLVKSLETNEAYGIGKNGEIFDVTFGLYAAEDMTAADGEVIPADGLIEIVSLDGNGKGTVKSDLPIGSYYVQEISTNDAYIVSDQKYPVIFEYAGQDTAAVHISANDGNAIENELIYGSVSGKKSDEDGKALGGALIGIFKTGTTEFTKETAIATTVSAEDGSFSFAEVPYGTWVIREIESPKGFILSEEEIAVTISEVDEVVEIELVNYFIKGNIELTKVDKDYPENKLSGAVFEVYSDANGDGKLDKVDLGSDALGNLTRIENEIGKIPARLEAAKTRKAETLEQLANAKTEVLKPFAYEDELKEKTDRLNALNIELNLDEKDTPVMDTEPEQENEQPEKKTQDRER